MCVIIDACCLSKVFETSNRDHSNFTPILQWLHEGSGRMIYGGTKYGEELKRMPKVRRHMVELGRKGKLVRLETERVDSMALNLKRTVAHRDFNDEHLVALVITSRCCVVCTDDQKAIDYLKTPEHYCPADKRWAACNWL